MANCVWVLQQTADYLMYKIIGELPYPQQTKFDRVRMKVPQPNKSKSSNDSLLYSKEYYEKLLRQYFRLDIDLERQYRQWSKAHQHFANETKSFYAVRVLNQEPVENLFSFICSQNNHITRITSLVAKLCSMYGSMICTQANGTMYFTFPDIEKLADPSVIYMNYYIGRLNQICICFLLKVEAELRQELFGYRAKFIQKSAEEIMKKGGLEWLQKLEQLHYKDAHSELIKLTGIGPKVSNF